jgi:hypothetical protein
LFGIRAVAATGISDARIVVVDDLPIIGEIGSNSTASVAQEISFPVAVDGMVPPEQSRFFAINVAAGQSLTFEVVGHRIGSNFDPLLRIMDPAGKVFLEHDNDEGLGFDLRTAVTFPTAGRYVLELRDTRFGGSYYSYHLRVGDFPVGRVVYPPGGTRGERTAFSFPGKAITDLPPRWVGFAPDDPSPIASLSVAGSAGSSWYIAAVDPADRQVELEPNDETSAANPIDVGRTIEGRLDRAGDLDLYRFHCQSGQSILFRGEARRLASPADLVLRVTDAAGATLANVDDVPGAEAQLTFTAPAEGTFHLWVEDLHRRGGNQFVYRVETISPVQFVTVQPATDRIVISRGSSYPIPVQVQRTNDSKPIDLVTANKHPGLVSRPVTNVGSATSICVLDAAPDTPLGPATLTILARSSAEPKMLLAGTLTHLLRPKFDEILLLPPNLETQIAVQVVERSSFAMKARLESPALARFGSAVLTVEADRDKFTDEQIDLAVENLPPNVTVALQPIAKGYRSVALTVESKPGSPIGTFPLLISGVSTVAGRVSKSFAEVFDLTIRPGVALTTAVAEITINPGGSASAAIRVERLPPFAGPVEVAPINLPAGLTAAAVIVAEGQAEGMLVLSAAPDAPLTSVDNVVLRTSVMVNGQAETVDSSPIKLRVVNP